MGQKKKYMQLYDEMVKLIQTGKLAPGDRLPTEQELSHTFAVSRQTVRQALGKMKEAGLVSSLPHCRYHHLYQHLYFPVYSARH